MLSIVSGTATPLSAALTRPRTPSVEIWRLSGGHVVLSFFLEGPKNPVSRSSVLGNMAASKRDAQQKNVHHVARLTAGAAVTKRFL